ncbi:hypothetical protein V8E53_011285 [Lactarius tabidus]|jgi:hypothetical protein
MTPKGRGPHPGFHDTYGTHQGATGPNSALVTLLSGRTPNDLSASILPLIRLYGCLGPAQPIYPASLFPLSPKESGRINNQFSQQRRPALENCINKIVNRLVLCKDANPKLFLEHDMFSLDVCAGVSIVTLDRSSTVECRSSTKAEAWWHRLAGPSLARALSRWTRRFECHSRFVFSQLTFDTGLIGNKHTLTFSCFRSRKTPLGIARGVGRARAYSQRQRPLRLARIKCPY